MYTIKKLEWGEETPPNGACCYHHCDAPSPFGLVRIDWKGWKDYPSFGLTVNGEFVSCNACVVEGAKEEAQDEILRLFTLVVDGLYEGMLLDPESIKMPQSVDEARKTYLLAHSYLKHNDEEFSERLLKDLTYD